MKFTFYCTGKKNKKEQIIKAKTDDEIMLVAKIAKCELTKTQILKDLDFSQEFLMCKVDGEKLTMQELWVFLNKKFSISGTKSDKKKGKKNKKIKEKPTEKKKKKKKRSKKTNNVVNIKTTPISRGLISVTRKDK